MVLLFLSNSSSFQLIRKGKDEEVNEPVNHSHYDLNVKVFRACAAAQTCHFSTSKARTFSNWANPGAAKKTAKNKERRDTFLLWFSYILIFHLYLLSSFTKTW